MARFRIHESLLDELNKKMDRIAKKCKKYGCGFSYLVVGEEFEEVEEHGLQRYVIIEAEGTAQIDGWQFVATVRHLATGNVVSKALTEMEVPERYWHTTAVCEHCGTHRNRKDTYLVYNTETGEYKQVGKSCLMDYTHGMSAEMAACMAELRDVFDEYESGRGGGGIVYDRTWLEVDVAMAYAASAVARVGYVKRRDEDGEYNPKNTAALVGDIYRADTGRGKPDNRKEKYNIDEKDPQAIAVALAARAWILEQPRESEYIRNAQTVAALNYCSAEDLPILVSIIPVYLRHVEREEKRKREAALAANADYVGTEGKRITVAVTGGRCVATWDNGFGAFTHLYKWHTPEGATIVWKSTTYIDEERVVAIAGTVKEHKEYNGEKQTVLTRCRCYTKEEL